MAKTRTMEAIEQEVKRPIEDVLQELYQRHGSQSAVAAALGINQGTLSVWLLKLGLEQVTILRPLERA